MKRGGPLKRIAPLRATKPMARSSLPLKRAPLVQKRRAPAVPPKQKRRLADRSEGVCEIQINNLCQYFAADPCHRIGEKSGGRHGEAAERNDRLSNVLHGCRLCHDWTHLHPRSAEMNGWRLLEHANPLTARVLRRGEWVLLDDEGGFSPADECEGAE